MTEDALRQEAEEQTKQYMSKHTENYNCENTKLETDNYNVGREYGYEDGYFDGAWSRENRIADLEKENTELRVSCRIQVDTAFQTIYEKDDQLIKAKEIIKKLLATPRSIYGRDEDGENTSFFNPDYEGLEKQAKQLLKEIEK